MAVLSKGKIPVFLKAALKLLFDKAVTYELEAKAATLNLVILDDGCSLRNLWQLLLLIFCSGPKQPTSRG